MTADEVRSGEPRGRARRAVVLGGGLAGTTAALRLAEAGVETTLVETRPRLGGLAFSFRRDSAAGELTVDNGQHVYLRCCTAYSWLLDRVGGAGLAPLQERLDVPVLDVGGARPRLGRLRRTALPVPLHLAASLATYPHLSLAERASVGRAALALKGLDPADPALDGIDFGTWLHRHGQSERTIEALWDLVGTATLNARAPQASMGLAAMVFKTGLLSEPGAADIGWAHVPLGDIHDVLARAALDKAGVRTLLRTRARSVTPAGEGGGWRVAVDQGPDGAEELEAGTVVLAVPQREAHGLLPDGALTDPGRLLDIGTAPILNIHVIYDRKVLRQPFFTALGTPVQWVFDRTTASGLTGRGQYLALSQSVAHEEIDQPVATLRERYLPELERLLPAARGAGVRDFFVTRERTATFAPSPGVGRLRPGARTSAPGVYLAGAWTATGWPATMESAVRSGVTAAREALVALGRPHAKDPVPGIEGRAHEHH
ncbi:MULTISPECIES: hydroxysqualene dehydroxylase HpnE [unclassified Streptomyces]|uniref:hydroxysqualene dehydroxylase HpnE n=1 Tax=unclassified Streptomyces TaxID=2593676 RepID=UPI002DDC481B|nr:MULTISPECIES: hydroxysqualene dehydroxylase HpnE [unclassified Streptomyces]WSA91083.1 hydroxysqualene dehydroxylase HpnE [Streptomyces sp. NBC_01795]WSB75408.1 hydroxysqualene dehydroxylase HpnE [Streptomyces sp. NBC_01775]WSS45127.1 hydroxysqualene dehydroxylase HpnE [Streptomyces sp. NBC_01187]